MFAIDKAKFGAFVAAQRKAQGMTQKELAQRLYVSDKAVSKWETGGSLPDTALLLPLAEQLHVTVTELLLCERTQQALPPEQVETLVKSMLMQQEPQQDKRQRTRRLLLLSAAMLLGAIGLFLHYKLFALLSETLLTCYGLGAGFGIYLCGFAPATLPVYYDQNRITGMHHGAFRMNVPGVAFNNRNWPHILRATRIWSICAVLFPLFTLPLAYLPFWTVVEPYVLLAFLLGTLFVPVYVVGKKYQ